MQTYPLGVCKLKVPPKSRIPTTTRILPRCQLFNFYRCDPSVYSARGTDNYHGVVRRVQGSIIYVHLAKCTIVRVCMCTCINTAVAQTAYVMRIPWATYSVLQQTMLMYRVPASTSCANRSEQVHAPAHTAVFVHACCVTATGERHMRHLARVATGAT